MLTTKNSSSAKKRRPSPSPKATTKSPRSNSKTPKKRVSPSPKRQRSATPSRTSSEKAQQSGDVWTPTNYSTAEWIYRTWVGPALVLFLSPFFVQLASLAMLKTNGSIVEVIFNYKSSLGELFIEAFPVPNQRVIKAIALFVLFQFSLLFILPGKKYYGPISPSGERPVHTKNGDKAFVLTFALFFTLVKMELLDPCLVYDELMPMMTALNLSALLLSVFLLFKGIYFPSTKDHGSNYPWLFRFYEGEELYPAIFGVDLKNFVICRLGMMGWAVFTVSFSVASYREHDNEFTYPLLASAVLNFLYVVKFFFLYEEGYMSAGDIAVDRFGFMLAWGVVAFMPIVHNLHTLYLVKHDGWSIINSPLFLAGWFAVGLLLIFVNYDSDTQKHYVREMDGKCTIWGRPCEVIRAKYKTADGETHDSLLVVSGYTGIVRHFHYMPDIILLFMYCSPAGFDHLLPHTYFIYLTSLLVDRCFRLDKRCATKYGKYWEQYCRRVPYRLIPGVF